ncbi:MAG: hypothetical protein IE909_02645 [Campylobacterales bacterium]|nr:hypothetical protein [Campylobacterales bacterium]
MNDIIFLAIFFVALEFFESNWQKAPTFYGMLKNNYMIYEKSIFLFFLLNATFVYSIYLSYSLHNFSFLMMLIIGLKFADISFRLHLMSKIHKNEDISKLIPVDMPMNDWMRYFNVVAYPLTFLLSFI